MKVKSIKILVVDDDETDYYITHRLLKKIRTYELEVERAEDLPRAVEAIRNTEYDILFFDFLLGEYTGLDLIETVADDITDKETGEMIPVIFLTGIDDQNVVIEAMQHGVSDFLKKSDLSAGSVERTLTNVLEKHRLRLSVAEQRRYLENANKRLKKKNKEIQRFYQTVSHEIKTPLTSAREFIAIVADGHVAGVINEEQRECLRLAKESCDQMVLCINDLLDVSRLETGKMALKLDRHSLKDITQSAVDSMAPIAKEKMISLSQTVSSWSPSVRVDHIRIRQVIMNLLNNALKFTSEGGEVTVAVAQHADNHDYAAISVTDTGCGISNIDQQRIFNRLYQVKHDGIGSCGGLGLGLSICQKLTALHNGEISVESELNVGSRFTFTLPVA